MNDPEDPNFRWKICGYCRTAYRTPDEAADCVRECWSKIPESEKK